MVATGILYAVIVLAGQIKGIRAATSTLQLVSEYPYPYGSTLWRMNAQCSFIIPQDYTPNSAETGFRMKITLENHATGGIDANWPFDDNAVYANIGTETEINLPTQNSIYVYTGSYTWSFLIDFYNADSLTYGNWPTGTCSGPYSLDAGTWNTWGAWSSCSVTCEDGTTTRTRTCSVTGDCSGEETESSSCNEGACTADESDGLQTLLGFVKGLDTISSPGFDQSQRLKFHHPNPVDEYANILTVPVFMSDYDLF